VLERRRVAGIHIGTIAAGRSERRLIDGRSLLRGGVLDGRRSWGVAVRVRHGLVTRTVLRPLGWVRRTGA
jgi:hypothetical protein